MTMASQRKAKHPFPWRNYRKSNPLNWISMVWFGLIFTSSVLAQNGPTDSVTVAGKTYARSEGKWYTSQNGDLLDEIFLDTLIVGRSDRLPISEVELERYGVILKEQLHPGFAVLTIETTEDSFDVAAAMAADHYDVSFDTKVTFLSNAIPNDFYYGPSGLFLGQWPLFRIGMPTAWNLTQGNPNIVVAVSDTGVQYSHSDLSGNLWTNPLEIANNGLDDDHNGKVDDTKGWDFVDDDNDPNPLSPDGTEADPHGTNVAGIIAARANNSIGVAGVAGGWNQPGVSYMPLRANQRESVLMASVLYAVQSGAHVVNMSWGVGTPCGAMVDLFAYLDANYDCVLIAAAGNAENRPVLYPARFPSTIAVGSCNHLDDYAGDSYGPELDLVAPKGSITTDPLRAPGTNPTTLEEGWEEIHGVFSLDYNPNFSETSSAAPLVSGGAGLMLSYNVGLSPAQIREMLQNSAEKVKPGDYDYNWNPSMPGHSLKMGYGILRVDLALTLSNLKSYVNLQLPSPGSYYPIGASIPITWYRKGYTGPVNVKLYNSRGFVRTLATSLKSSSLNWVNPGDLSANRDYRIKIEANYDPSMYDFSDRPFGLAGLAPLPIPDSNFLSALIAAGFDSNADQGIDTNEAARVVNLNVSGKNIADLSGLEWFQNLKSLDCSHNQITDMSPVRDNQNFMARCDKSIDFSYNWLDFNSEVGVCGLACSPWLLFEAGFQLKTEHCLCWNPPCEE